MRHTASAKPVVRRLLFQLLSCLLILSQTSCMKQSRYFKTDREQSTAATVKQSEPSSQPLVNINTATREELERLPGIGQALAARIVEHREKYGPFRRTEYLLMVRGISAQRLSAISAFLTVE